MVALRCTWGRAGAGPAGFSASGRERGTAAGPTNVETARWTVGVVGRAGVSRSAPGVCGACGACGAWAGRSVERCTGDGAVRGGAVEGPVGAGGVLPGSVGAGVVWASWARRTGVGGAGGAVFGWPGGVACRWTGGWAPAAAAMAGPRRAAGDGGDR
ncbi:hypothetical protein GCM10023220_65330 [Streptomyces ziwulingensis]|uniref:Uncharacterized protein n=1 Tax=Streptomyces ziwulingensis TaxID=1045501 RepID=A0ABP9D434_9ACTN